MVFAPLLSKGVVPLVTPLQCLRACMKLFRSGYFEEIGLGCPKKISSLFKNAVN
jgi:hypothetical protein